VTCVLQLLSEKDVMVYDEPLQLILAYPCHGAT
jgi:hypothetical protein